MGVRDEAARAREPAVEEQIGVADFQVLSPLEHCPNSSPSTVISDAKRQFICINQLQRYHAMRLDLQRATLTASAVDACRPISTGSTHRF
jgi:hypothetical protein